MLLSHRSIPYVCRLLGFCLVTAQPCVKLLERALGNETGNFLRLRGEHVLLVSADYANQTARSSAEARDHLFLCYGFQNYVTMQGR